MYNRRACPSAFDVVNFINKDTTIESFYNYITNNETNFDYDINQPSHVNDWTPLHSACTNGNNCLVKALIKMGAYINPIRQSAGYTPLDEAIEINNPILIEILKKNGAKLCTEADLQCAERNRLFKAALNKNNVEQAAEILNKNLINLSLFNTAVFTQTRIVAEKGYFEMVKLLVSYGGEIIENVDDITTSMAARKANYNEMAEYLEKVQKIRYQKLKSEVIYEKYGKLFIMGLFADKNSNLYKGLAGAAKDIATQILSFRL